MKKEATAAASALLTFQYRPGRGMTITGADKSWAFNTTYRLNLYNYNTLGGKSNYNENGTRRVRRSRLECVSQQHSVEPGNSAVVVDQAEFSAQAAREILRQQTLGNAIPENAIFILSIRDCDSAGNSVIGSSKKGAKFAPFF
jgi:hypothetical protein